MHTCKETEVTIAGRQNRPAIFGDMMYEEALEILNWADAHGHEGPELEAMAKRFKFRWKIDWWKVL